jgi:hypothetical protein
VEEGLANLRTLTLLDEQTILDVVSGFQHRRIHWTRLWSLVVLGWFLAKRGALSVN